MKIKTLLDAYKTQVNSTPNVSKIFSESGMVKDFPEFYFGFFPVGSGIFTEKGEMEEANIQEGGTLVLGNDFGTINYVKTKCKNNRENNSKTIKNLQNIGLKIEETFFTNFYMGLRDDKNHPGITMTSVMRRQKAYKDFCFTFFKKQLEMIEPKVVICLGVEVGKALSSFSDTFKSSEWGKATFMKLYSDSDQKNYIVNTNDEIFGDRKFILIPHPSYAHINWKNDIEQKIKDSLNN